MMYLYYSQATVIRTPVTNITAGDCSKKSYKNQYIRHLDPGFLTFQCLSLVFPSRSKKCPDPW